jgi:phosphoserine phosphatase
MKPATRPFYDQYKAGTLDIHEFLDFQLKPLSRHPRAQLDAWHADFMARKIIPMIAAGTPALLDKASRRCLRHRHRHQQFRHRADRRASWRAASDRHRTGTI